MSLRKSVLISHPAASRSYIAEYDRIRLMPVDSLMEKRPVIDLPLSTRALSAGTIEPLLEDIPVTSQGIFKRLHIDFIIFFRPVNSH